MLDPKHRNIGATVGMLKLLGKLTDDNDLPEEITKLFMAEAESCDHKHSTGQCTFHAGEDLIESLQTGNSEITFQCRIGECPLGREVDKECADRTMLYGKNTMHFGYDPEPTVFPTRGGHIHIGYTGWRKYWNMFKKNLFRGWIDWLKGWPPYLRKHWKLNLLVVAGVFAVYYGSALAGHYSTYLW